LSRYIVSHFEFFFFSKRDMRPMHTLSARAKKELLKKMPAAAHRWYFSLVARNAAENASRSSDRLGHNRRDLREGPIGRIVTARRFSKIRSVAS
jgi:hypothetical protein